MISKIGMSTVSGKNNVEWKCYRPQTVEIKQVVPIQEEN